MKLRSLAVSLLALALSGSAALVADVKSQERTQVRFEGGLGRIVNFFGGKGARDGIVSTVAVKGDRMLSMNDTTGEIIDLREEKVYQLDVKKKTYTVVTFAEMRRQMEEAMARARKEAESAPRDEPQPPEPKPEEPAREYEVDFSVKETGRTRQVAGHDTKESLATVIVREKGKAIEDGGMVMETSMWMAPEISALEELQDFRVRYARQVYGPVAAQAAADMSQAIAMYPQMKDAMARFQEEGGKISGTALLTEMRFQVQAPPQSAAEEPKKEAPPPTSVGGLLGGFGRRMARKKEEAKEDPNAVPGRATVMTMTVETLQVAASATDADVALPSGFKPR